jgi:Fe-S-cluster containining protein
MMENIKMASATKPPIARGDLKPGEVLCDYCSAKCCRYFALAMETPTERNDLDFIRWYVLHEAATVFTEDDTWYLLVHTPCRHLQSDNRCGIYHTRPSICRDYSTDNCEYDDRYVYDRYFETAEQVQEYMDVIFPDKEAGFRSPRPPLLPIVG